jgi:mannosyltransferase OCH1-like enzyme
MIPKIVFTYWEGDQLSELHYLTIYSFHKYNPELDIIIYTDENPKNILREWDSHEHSIDIKKKITLSNIIEINSNKIFLKPINFQKEYNFDNNISIIFKADFIRIAKLYEHGGIWFDMDILFIKPLPDFFFNEDVDSYIFIYGEVIATGLLAFKNKSNFLKKLYNSALNIITNKNLDNYQKIGPIIWIKEYKKLIKKETSKINILDNNLVYPIFWNELHYLFKQNNNSNKIFNNTFGIHWYNGAPTTKEFINNFNMNNINPENSLFEKLVYRMNNNLLQEVPEVPEVPEVQIDIQIDIQINNKNNLEKIQNEYYEKALNCKNNIIIQFIIPEKLLKNKVLTFYKCWRNGYCLNNSGLKLPKNIKKVYLKKL